jgi:hypothetical protein
MTNAQKEELAASAIEMYEQGISVHIPKKVAVGLFGTVIVANIATVFVMQAMVIVAKRFKKDEDGTVEVEVEVN